MTERSDQSIIVANPRDPRALETRNEEVNMNTVFAEVVSDAMHLSRRGVPAAG